MSTLSEEVADLEAETKRLKADLSKAATRAEDVRTAGLSIGAGNLILDHTRVPRVITADELREGDKYAVIWTHENSNELVDIVQSFPGHNLPTKIQGNGGWIDKETIVAIVLLEDAPEPEPTPELPKVGDQITTARTLDTLPVAAVVLDADGDTWQKHANKQWRMAGDNIRATSGQGLCDYLEEDAQVFTILHLPGGGDDA